MEIEDKLAELTAQYQVILKECTATMTQYREVLNKKEAEFFEIKNQIMEQIDLCRCQLREQEIEYLKAKDNLLKTFEDERNPTDMKSESKKVPEDAMCSTCAYCLEDDFGWYCDLTEEPVRGCYKACENYSEGD